MDLNWIMPRVKRCENMIWKVAQKIVNTGGTVVLDLGFMKEAHRRQFLKMAEELNYSTQLHYINAPEEIRHARVMARNSEKGETFTFKVTSTMFKYMEKQFEPPTPKESESAIVFDTDS